MATDDLVAWDNINRELRTVPEAFGARPRGVLSVVWRAGVEVGGAVKAGAELADIQWADNTRDVVRAPAGCSGSIAAVNRDIAFETLHTPPSVTLLRLD